MDTNRLNPHIEQYIRRVCEERARAAFGSLMVARFVALVMVLGFAAYASGFYLGFLIDGGPVVAQVQNGDKPAATPAPAAAPAKVDPPDFEEQALLYREQALNAKVDAAISPTLNKVREQLLENIRKDQSVVAEIAAIDAARQALVSRKVKESGKSVATHTYDFQTRTVVEKPKESVQK